MKLEIMNTTDPYNVTRMGIRGSLEIGHVDEFWRENLLIADGLNITCAYFTEVNEFAQAWDDVWGSTASPLEYEAYQMGLTVHMQMWMDRTLDLAVHGELCVYPLSPAEGDGD